MKKTGFISVFIVLLFLFAGCASSSKSDKTVQQSSSKLAVFEVGKFTVGEVQQFTDDNVNIQYMYEETTGLKIDCKDGKDYYKGKCLYGLGMSEIKEILGEEKFEVYWAICYAITQIGKGEDNRLIKYNFPNKDYFIIDLQGNIQEDMVMKENHSDPNEIVDLQILLPINIDNSN